MGAVFLEVDLVAHLRQQYEGADKCLSTSKQVPRSGGSVSAIQTTPGTSVAEKLAKELRTLVYGRERLAGRMRSRTE